MNKSTRLTVTCPYCQFSQCLSCFKIYLLGSVKQNPECMSCHRELSLDFIAETTPKVFHNQEYRSKRADMLLSQERSLLPDTQHMVEAVKEERQRTIQLNDLIDEERYLKIRMAEIRKEISRVVHPDRNTDTAKPVERKKFMMGCPAQDCRGFLSQAWKCGTCDVYVCSKCRVIKGAREDVAHECNPDDVATAKMLHDETKPCPCCAAPIFKISGCFAPDTPILMFNGTNKRADEIVIGDELVGDDGAVRNVLDLVSGYDQMYLVKQNKGDSYVVNSEHMLVLHMDTDSDMTHITVKDYIELPDGVKKYFKGYKYLIQNGDHADDFSDIEVVSVEYGNYYGWTVDGNHRFLLRDFTVVKNCDQMYHAECGTAFSWNTGKIDTGVVHNPHFYEWQRAQNNGVAPRVPGDRPNGGCGGLPWDSVVRRCIRDRGIVFEHWLSCYILINHITHVVMHNYPARIGLQDNSDLRVKFLMNDIDEALWAKTLCTRQKRAEKNHAVHQILELLTVSLTDLFTTFAAGDTDNIAEAAEALKDYVNREFIKISKRYNNKTLFITHEWRIL